MDFMTVNSKQVKRLRSLTYVAGAAGLEPANGGVKVRCVTASPRPYVVLVRLAGSLCAQARKLFAFGASSSLDRIRFAGMRSNTKDDTLTGKTAGLDVSQSRCLWGG